MRPSRLRWTTRPRPLTLATGGRGKGNRTGSEDVYKMTSFAGMRGAARFALDGGSV